MAKITPPGFTVYERDLPGYTVRVAINPDDVPNHTPEERGWRLSLDQDSPVYSVMRKNEDKIEHGGQDYTEDDRIQRLKEAKLKAASDRHKSSILDFAVAQKRLVLEGRVPDHVAEHRLTICTGVTKDGTHVSDKCTHYVKEDKGRGSGHCEGCGCPKWAISEMSRNGNPLAPGKAWYPMPCPKGKFSEHDGRRKRVEAGSS